MREPGYYWVKFGDDKWQIAFIDGIDVWMGHELYEITDLFAINETRIKTPDEQA